MRRQRIRAIWDPPIVVPPATPRQMWLTVARLRQRAGDLEGAARARRSATLSGPLRTGLPRAYRERADSLRRYRTHLERSPGHGGAECGSPAKKSTPFPWTVDCGNCKRTRRYRRLIDEQASDTA